MAVNVGFIGSRYSCARATEAATHMASLHLQTYEYSDPTDTSTQYTRAVAENDALCFSGVLPYYYRDQNLEHSKPICVGSFGDYDLLSSVIQIQQIRGIALDHISIDILNRQVYDNVIADTGISIPAKHLYSYDWMYQPGTQQHLDLQEIIDFHSGLYNEQQTQFALTSIHRVHDLLQERGIPSMTVVESLSNYTDLFKEAMQSVMLDRLSSSLVCAIYLTEPGGNIESDRSSNNRSQQLMGFLETFAHENTQKPAQWMGAPIRFYFTTKGDYLQNEQRLLQLLGQSYKDSPDVACGVGFGKQLAQAQTNAHQALQIALSGSRKIEPGQALVLLDEKQRISTDRSTPKTSQKSLRAEPWIRDLAQNVSAHANTLEEFFLFIINRDLSDFSSLDWALHKQVTERTAERFIRRLLEANIISVNGYVQVNTTGRPRNMYALNPEYTNKIR